MQIVGETLPQSKKYLIKFSSKFTFFCNCQVLEEALLLLQF